MFKMDLETGLGECGKFYTSDTQSPLKGKVITWKLVTRKLGNVDICICIYSDLELHRILTGYYRSIHHIAYLGNQLNSMGCNHHSHKCVFIEKHGNMEVEIERMGGNMDHEQQKNPICNKTLF